MESKTAVKSRPERRKRGEETQARIMDVAERLFARHGYDGVTIRQITREAGVDVALAHYYFDTKRGLFDAVFLRRAQVLNQERLAALSTYEKAAMGAMTIEGIIDAFVRPLYDRLADADPQWVSYFQLIAQVNNTPEWGGQVMTKYFDPVVQKFIAALRQAIPNAVDEELYWSYQFLSGALTLTFAETNRIDNLSGGICRSTDIEAIKTRLPKYIAAGFRALCLKE